MDGLPVAVGVDAPIFSAGQKRSGKAVGVGALLSCYCERDEGGRAVFAPLCTGAPVGQRKREG